MSRKIKALQEKRKPRAKCIHYWIIESPMGPTSMGICKFCGAVSEFQNYMPYPSWENRGTKPSERHELPDIESDEESNNNS